MELIHPIGFCAGVRRAVDMFYSILSRHGERPVYVLHELVHNRSVSEKMKKDGARFVDSVSQIPDGSTVLLGAHGCGQDVEQECAKRHLKTYDASCPLVKRLQQVASLHSPELPLILLGDAEHPEIKAVVNRAQHRPIYVIQDETTPLPPMTAALFLSQTTRNAEEVEQIGQHLKQQIPQLENKAQVCDAVLQRQKAVEELASRSDLMLIIGSPHSSNARRLLDIARQHTTAYMVETAADIRPEWFANARHIGIGAGTSTPDWDISEVCDRLDMLGL